MSETPTQPTPRALLSATANLILLASAAILLVVGGTVGFVGWRVDGVARQTNRIVKVEVQEKNVLIEQQQFVIEEQATPAIVYMLTTMQKAGLQPPLVLLNPNCPPFDPKETEPPDCPPPKPEGD